jgi:hypothetical protein
VKGISFFVFLFSFYFLLSLSRDFLFIYFTFLECLGRGKRNEIPTETRWQSKKGGGPKESKQQSPS